VSHHHAPSGPGVVLDIGGDVGAMVVYLGGQATGEELDIQPVGDPGGRFHTGIHPRPLDGDVVRVAVFPEVRTGDYELLDELGAPFASVAAAGGEVRTLDLRAG
jgi:hypothetical protein